MVVMAATVMMTIMRIAMMIEMMMKKMVMIQQVRGSRVEEPGSQGGGEAARSAGGPGIS